MRREVEWYFTVCTDIGSVNEICCGSSDLIARRMLDTFDHAGYKWVNNVDGQTEMVYRLDRRMVG